MMESVTLIHFFQSIRELTVAWASLSDQTFSRVAPRHLCLCLTFIWTCNSANTETQCVGETANESISL